MNLVEKLRHEIAELNLTDELQIAQYIYKRTGEEFNYDPLWIISTKDELEAIREKIINVHDIENFDITCFSWARVYHDLLTEFGIPSEVKYVYSKENPELKTHGYVEVQINNKAYLADLTASYQDMIRIKYGFETYYNCQMSKRSYEKVYTYDGDSSPEFDINEFVEQKFDELLDKVREADRSLTDLDEFTYIVYKYVADFINTIKVKTGYVIGIKYIQSLLRRFLGPSYLMQNIYFYDRNDGIYIAVHQVLIDGAMHYFAYRLKGEDVYEFREISMKEVGRYFDQYTYKFSQDLNTEYLKPFENGNRKILK